MKKTVLLITMLALTALAAEAQTTKNIPERHPVLTQDEIVANIENTVAEVMRDW